MFRFSLALIFLLLLAACSGTNTDVGEEGTLHVVATMNILADVARAVGGDAVQVTSLIPPGADPHTFEPSPQDVARIDQANLVLLVGLGLEQSLEDYIDHAGVEARLVSASTGIEPRRLSHSEDEEEEAGEEHADSEFDPHVWLDPNLVLIWVDNIAAAFSELDPPNAALYQANAQAYQAELKALDAWIQDQVAQVPVENRKIVMDHMVLGYFAERYGFTEVGTVVQGFSSIAEPSAQELAELENAIRDQQVKAIFYGNTFNPELSRQIAQDTGVQLARVYTESVIESNGVPGSYLDTMRYNVETITRALQGSPE